MRYILVQLCGIAAFFAFACKNNNDELARKMEAAHASYRDSIQVFQRIVPQIDSLMRMMNGAEPSFAQTPMWKQATESTAAQKSKYDATLQGYNDLLARLEKLKSSYVIGDIAKVEVEQEYAVIHTGLRQHKEVFDKMAERLKGYAIYYRQIEAKFKEDPGAFKAMTKPE